MTDFDVSRVDSLCAALFGADASARKQAELELAPLCRPEGLPKLRAVLEGSGDGMAHYFVAATLLRMVTEGWTSFQVDQQLQLEHWLLNVLWGKGATMARHNFNTLLLVLCRVIKFGWFDSPQHQELPGRLLKEMSANQHMAPVGLSLLTSLVAEVNMMAPRHNITQHRKTAVSFRDLWVLEFFQAALSVLRSAGHRDTADPSLGPALKLVLECLSYDFVGLFPDESSDEAGAVQLPNSWRPAFTETDVMGLFWDLYARLPVPLSTDCMRCLVQLATVRRSFFATDEERRAWLQRLLTGALGVLARREGLLVPDNYFEFCRLLSRIKPNYQIAELVNAEAYAQWVEACAKFTIEAFVNWPSTAKSHFFLLTLWTRLVTSQPFLRGADKPSLLEGLVPQLTEAYVESRLQLAQAAVLNPNGLDDSVDHQENLLGHLELIPVLARAVYGRSGPALLQRLAPLMQELQAGTQLPEGARQSADAVQKFALLESQAAWLVYIMGALVGHHVTGSSSAEAERVDGEITAALFQLCGTMGARAHMPGATRSETLQQLERAILHFFQCFRKVHIGESSMPCSKVYPRLHELTGVKDHLAVLDVIVTKMVTNLKVWRACPAIVGDTLTLLCDLSSGYSSGRFLLKLDTVKLMLEHHSGPEFPFLQEQFNTPHRSKFYQTMANIQFMDTYAEAPFEHFMRPLKEVCLQLEALPTPEGFQAVPVKRAVVGLLRDLRGILASCANKRSYALLFEWLFPAHIELLQKMCKAYAMDHDVSVPLLKFFADFVHSRSQRIVFEPNSPNGILLFKLAAELLVVYGQARLAMVLPATLPAKDIYTLKYKGYRVCMAILQRCLSGNFCNFGAMTYYQDDTLDRAMGVVLQMAVSIPLEDFLTLEKVGCAHYHLMETLFQNYCPALSSLDTRSFLHLMSSLEQALRSSLLPRPALCSATAAVGYLMSFYYTHRQKPSPAAVALSQHFAADADLLARLLTAVFHAVLFEDTTSNQWAISRCMLPLILIHPAFYEEYQRSLVQSLPPERQAKMKEAFGKLMEGVQPNLDTLTRDRFTTNVTTFRHLAKTAL